jgi:phosphatidylglycerophosphatase A
MANGSFTVKVATLGGIGRIPFAPGTMACILAGIPAAYLLALCPRPLQAVLLILLFALGCYAADKSEKEMARDDPKEVVIDELIGFMVTMIWVPFTLTSLLLGFAAFRLFDIWKPWPISVLDERVKGGLGIVLDDVGAGVLAHALLWVLTRL